MSNSEWGAIPRSLANDVSNMIEKKMGTSSGYKPVEWVSQINLMGKLPIKSASGAIASFADGADGVPVKSCVVSFLPSGGGGTPSAPVAIQGVSGLSVVKTGINLWDEEVELGSISSSTGADSVSTNSLRTKNYIPVIPQMALYCKNGTLTATNMQVRFYDKNKSYLGYINYMGNAVQWNASSGGSRCIVPENAYYMRFALQSAYGTTYLNDISINCPITDTDYHAHKTPSVVTDTFGQTIYGGTRDLTTDKASVTWHRVKISDLSFVKDANCQHTFRCSGMISPYNRKYGNGNFNIKAEVFATYTAQHSTGSNIATLETGHDFNIFINGGSNTFYISCDSSYDSKTATGFTTDFGDVYLYYELATTTEITGLTPHEIDTLYGDNNIYADTGTTSVEYRADIDLALNA